MDEQHIAEPGLVVLDITGRDEDIVRAVMAALGERWATSGVGQLRRDPGEPSFRARIHADVLRPGRQGPCEERGRALREGFVRGRPVTALDGPGRLSRPVPTSGASSGSAP
ncbi:DUF6207 family protein [Streptomyces sp. NRRL S-448]|uniref:DUF6207 family protein n=1 Tax=Streptomyces sp. NRRL S-448 TaxID=1463907 RepID=UPI0035623210